MRKIKRRRKYNKKDLYFLIKEFGLLEGISIQHRIFCLCNHNGNLSYYLSYLMKLSNYMLHNNKVKSGWLPKENGWFYVINNQLFTKLPVIRNKSQRSRLDIKLEKLGYIKTKSAGPKNRKYYRINTKKIKAKNDSLQCCDIATLNKVLYISKDIYNGVSFSREKLTPSNFKNKKPNKSVEKKRLVKRKSIEKVISHWVSKGPPFAGVSKRESIYPILKKLLKSNSDKEINRVVDIGFEYFSNPYFTFNNKKCYIKNFFQINKYNTFESNFLGKNKVNSWFKLFQTKGNQWFESNLLSSPKIKNEEVYLYLKDYFGLRNDNKFQLIFASNKMTTWMEKNDYPLRTIATDFDNFIRDRYPDIRDFKIYWLKGSKFWNEQFAKYLVQFGRYKSTTEIKEV